jgi:hypothetical protein
VAVTQTLLTSGFSNVTPHTVATTASIAPTANRLVLLDIFINTVVAGDAADPTVSGGGVTWTRVTSVNTTAAGCNLSRWRALSASPTSGTVSITHPSGSFCGWSISEFAGIDTGGTNGANAIVQSATNSNITGSANTVTATLAAFGSANNGAASAHGFFNVAPLRTATPDTGWTETAEQGSTFDSGSFAASLETQWRATNDTTALATWSGTGGVFALSSEIKASVAVDDTADGVTITATATVSTAGTASGVRNPTAAGATLTATASISTAGTAEGVQNSEAAGTTIAATASLIAGTATAAVNGEAAAATVTATASLIAGTADGVQNSEAAAVTLTATASLVAGSASGSGSATAPAATVTATASISASGAAEGTRSETALGAMVTAIASLIAGIASGEGGQVVLDTFFRRRMLLRRNR